MTENQYQAKLIRKLHDIFPGCIISKMDTAYQQGIPDLLILWKDRWAFLEVKLSASASEQPNQDHYIKLSNKMSFAAFIYPENEEEVLYELQKAFKPPRRTRIS